jgi:hypothetical protein
VALAAAVAIASWIVFNVFDGFMFFEPIINFYYPLPEDAVPGFILSNVTAALLGIIASMNVCTSLEVPRQKFPRHHILFKIEFGHDFKHVCELVFIWILPCNHIWQRRRGGIYLHAQQPDTAWPCCYWRACLGLLFDSQENFRHLQLKAYLNSASSILRFLLI